MNSDILGLLILFVFCVILLNKTFFSITFGVIWCQGKWLILTRWGHYIGLYSKFCSYWLLLVFFIYLNWILRQLFCNRALIFVLILYLRVHLLSFILCKFRQGRWSSSEKRLLFFKCKLIIIPQLFSTLNIFTLNFFFNFTFLFLPFVLFLFF